MKQITELKGKYISFSGSRPLLQLLYTHTHKPKHLHKHPRSLKYSNTNTHTRIYEYTLNTASRLQTVEIRIQAVNNNTTMRILLDNHPAYGPCSGEARGYLSTHITCQSHHMRPFLCGDYLASITIHNTHTYFRIIRHMHLRKRCACANNSNRFFLCTCPRRPSSFGTGTNTTLVISNRRVLAALSEQ